MSAAIDPADDDTDMWTAPAADYDLPTFTSAGSQAWRADAACRGMDTAVFFPGRGQNGAVAAAKAICNGCPVATECHAEAMLDPMNSGIWGATSHRQRRHTRSANNPVESLRHRKPIPHGTNAGYQAHRRRPDDPATTECGCIEAHTAYRREAANRRALARTITATHADKAAA
jgi:WhiB family redox-sensing transcriptional regulator